MIHAGDLDRGWKKLDDFAGATKENEGVEAALNVCEDCINGVTMMQVEGVYKLIAEETDTEFTEEQENVIRALLVSAIKGSMLAGVIAGREEAAALMQEAR